MQRNDCTRLHKLLDCISEKKISNQSEQDFTITKKLLDCAHVFIVKHNWSAAIGEAIDDVGGKEIVLPYNSCVFEFRINSKTVIVLSMQSDGEIPQIIPFVEAQDGWWCNSKENSEESLLFKNVFSQIKAICVALDAQVATHEVVRAPNALNKKRLNSGKNYIRDFHMVDLSKRHRTIGPGTRTHKSPRLHFRRGHWRHYEDHKTWIKWMLVGNPDLGFVDKQYCM